MALEWSIAGYRDTGGDIVDLEGAGQTFADSGASLDDLERVVLHIGEGEDSLYVTLHSTDGFTIEELDQLADYWHEIYG